IREEITEDIPEIFEINEATFGRSEEAILVDRLRAKKAVLHSLVAVQDRRLVGHALFSPILIHGHNGVVKVVAALGPVAVLPSYQKQGIGGELINTGIEMCREAGYQAIIVLGHPDYYPRFGFQSAAPFGISSTYDVPDDAFMVLVLDPDALNELKGVAHYHPEFDGV
ncbi:MAG: GNAT family N-acetyltransferase, partial [Candidatus Promineifilaceae bacterium]